MKKLTFSMLAMTGLLFAACADKDVIVESGGQQGEATPNGYMSLSINLPTTPSTRAANDVFDDGIETEYRVSDCALLLFMGEPDGAESDAVLLSAQDIVYPFDKEIDDSEDDDNITTSYQVIAKVDGYQSGKKL